MDISRSNPRLRARRLALCAFAMLGLLLSAPIGWTGPVYSTDNPWERLGVSMFDSEHAFLLDEYALGYADPLVRVARSKSRAGIRYNAPSKCLPASLRRALMRVSKRYGPITVSSTFRTRKKNRRVGGRSKSYHLNCRAVDFRVHGRTRGLISFLRKQKGVGGVKRYRSGFYHIDNGPRRTW